MLITGAIIIGPHHSDRETPEEYRTPRPLGDTAAFLLGIIGGVITWAVWLTRGDQANYAPAQIVGLAVTGVALIVGLSLLCRWWKTGPLSVGLGGFLGFTTSWAVQAGFYDSTGLWGVGYLMMVVGGGVAIAVLCAVIIALRCRAAEKR